MTILTRVLLNAYGGVWRVATPFLKRHKRLRDGFSERLVPDNWFMGDAPASPLPDNGKPVRLWIQAASGGEAWLTHSLLPALEKAFRSHTQTADRPLEALLTTCTRQGMDVLEKLRETPGMPERFTIRTRFFPLDRPALMNKAMRQARPDAVLLLETELWPGLLAAAKKYCVPVLVLNGRMTEKSRKAYRLPPSLWKALPPKKVLAVTEADAGRFADVFTGKKERPDITVMRNIKFDRVAPGVENRKAPDAAASLRNALGLKESSLLCVLASVREEEEDMLLPVIRTLHGQHIDGSTVVFAVAPRHMHRVADWRRQLASAHLPCLRRSTGRCADSGKRPPVIIWNTFGELEALYGISDIIFVGGSLAPLGGQNFLEPLAQGRIPLVGPHIDNFHWVGKDIFQSSLVLRLAGADELVPALETLLPRHVASLREQLSLQNEAAPDWEKARAAIFDSVRDRFTAWLTPRTGGSDAAADAVLHELLSS